MTKGNYKAIAEVIESNTQGKESQNEIDEGIRRGGKYIALALADYFAELHNSQFNREKFLQACGVMMSKI